MFKKVISFLLSILFVSSLITGSWAAAPDYSGSVQRGEYARAVTYGFVSAELQGKNLGDTITYREYCAMIAALVRVVDSSLANEWNKIAALGLQSDEKMLRDQGCVVLYRAMELLGMDHIPYDYIASTPNVHQIDYGEPSYDYRAFAGDEPWVFKDVEHSDLGGRRSYWEAAIMMCY